MRVILLLCTILSFTPACSDSQFNSSGGGSARPQTNDQRFQQPANQQPVNRDPFGAGTDFDSTAPDPNNLFSGNGADSVVTFAMLVNDFKCGMCHTTVRGNIVSNTPVDKVIWENSNLVVEGDWHISGTLRAGQGSGGRVIDIKGALNENYSGNKLPQDNDGDGSPDFPTFDPQTIKSKMKGFIKDANTNVQKHTSDNVVLSGTIASPIELLGEVLIEGDLVIKGRFKGTGNVYVTGNIYITGDILATKSPFPFDDDQMKAREQAKQRMSPTYDALALASKNAIIVSDFRNVFDHPETPTEFRSAAIGAFDVYDWYPGGKQAFESEMLSAGPQPCSSHTARLPYTISRIDAFLYAEKVIGGRASHNSYAINGGIMTDHFHIISAARDCSEGIHPIHGYSRKRNHINFDWRYVHGLQILKQMKNYFKN